MRKIELGSLAAVFLCSSLLVVPNVQAVNENASEKAKQIFEFWTPERRAAAIPRDMFLDENGQGYIRGNKGNVVPYGGKLKAPILPMAKGGKGGGNGGGGNGGTDGGGSDGGSGGTSDTTVTYTHPTEADNTITALPAPFTAYVEDPNGIKSVNFHFQPLGSTNTQQVSPTCTVSGAGYSCTVTVSSIANGDWNWWVSGKDGSRKGGVSYSSEPLVVDVNVPETPPPSSSCGGTVIGEAEWTCEGEVQTAAGRLLYQMGSSYYVCSGTVVNDGAFDRTVILTAAHCVYDDASKAFATNVMFIPDQDGTTGNGTDFDCSNDPLGCWAVSFGVVDPNWASREWPNNIDWDYAYYVVENVGSHSPASGSSAGPDTALDSVAGIMDISFTAPQVSTYTYALGYSYNMDPSFRYCAQGMSTAGSVNWWLGNCGMSGGASGGPWTQSSANDLGKGPLMSVNSWGYTNQPGMAGPKLNDNTASCLFDRAINQSFSGVINNGVEGC